MSEYFQCGVFRVHAPTRILKEEMLERRQMREAKINAITKFAEKMCKYKGKDGNYINSNVAIQLTEDKTLYIYFENGQYDIYLHDAETDDRRVDVVPSEIDAIVDNSASITKRMGYVLSGAEKDVIISYAPPKEVESYHAQHSPDINPIRGSPYNKAKYNDFERE